jgi:hypothetical protein
MSLKDCSQERFDELIEEQAWKAGVSVLLSLPGVWEAAAEHFNNAVCELLESGDDNEEAKEVEDES